MPDQTVTILSPRRPRRRRPPNRRPRPTPSSTPARYDDAAPRVARWRPCRRDRRPRPARPEHRRASGGSDAEQLRERSSGSAGRPKGDPEPEDAREPVDTRETVEHAEPGRVEARGPAEAIAPPPARSLTRSCAVRGAGPVSGSRTVPAARTQRPPQRRRPLGAREDGPDRRGRPLHRPRSDLPDLYSLVEAVTPRTQPPRHHNSGAVRLGDVRGRSWPRPQEFEHTRSPRRPRQARSSGAATSVSKDKNGPGRWWWLGAPSEIRYASSSAKRGRDRPADLRVNRGGIRVPCAEPVDVFSAPPARRAGNLLKPTNPAVVETDDISPVTARQQAVRPHPARRSWSAGLELGALFRPGTGEPRLPRSPHFLRLLNLRSTRDQRRKIAQWCRCSRGRVRASSTTTPPRLQRCNGPWPGGDRLPAPHGLSADTVWSRAAVWIKEMGAATGLAERAST